MECGVGRMAMDLDLELKAFMEAMKKNGCPMWMFERDKDGNFEDMGMAYAWYAWQEKAKAQAVPVWISVDDHMPESLRNVLVLLDANPAKNQNYMVAHFIPKFTEEYHGDDDWYDYDEERGCGYIKEGWYANTAYIGDEYSSYFIEEKVTHWKQLKEASESGAEQ